MLRQAALFVVAAVCVSYLSVRREALGADQAPVRQVTLVDLFELKLPTPTRSRVSFPGFSYRDAWPQDAGAREGLLRGPGHSRKPEEIVIKGFREAPSLRDRGKAPEGWEALWDQHIPRDLPPVGERLPRNPAVVVGPDGVGNYGGVWRRATASAWDLTRKVCYESLVRHGPSGELQPALAYKWEVSDDNRVFTFYLRKGHRWSDGHPFTSHDIVWMCNDVIGSGCWPTPPGWMRARDGSRMLYPDDVPDWVALARRIKQEAEADGPSPGKQFRAHADKALWKTIDEIAAGHEPDKTTRYCLCWQMLPVFRAKTFYTSEAWAGVDLESEIKALLDRGASRLSRGEMECLNLLMERNTLLEEFRRDTEVFSKAMGELVDYAEVERLMEKVKQLGLGKLTEDELDRLAILGQLARDESMLSPRLTRLNLLLFRAAYPDLVRKAAKERVQVQGVPDESGDVSHIVRFTFRQPNSIFLEETTTFLFYQGLLSTPRHHFAPFHPVGSMVLSPVDILDWELFARELVRGARTPAASPARRLWALLDPETRARVQRASTGDQTSSPDQMAIVDAINRALAGADFYQPEAWTWLDLKRLQKDLTGQAYQIIGGDARQRALLNELLVLEDLLRRVGRHGIGDLSADERLRMNVMLFRTAFGVRGKPAVALTREAALNEAARRDPRRFTGWITRFRRRGRYDPEHSAHVPTLGAWRVVSEPDAAEVLAVRNPYYYRVDAAGNQLPYWDGIRNTVVKDRGERLVRLQRGEVDFQSRDLEYVDLPELGGAEERGGYRVRLWPTDYCGELVICPLQAHEYPEYRKLQDDPRFRHALSLAINRQEIINKVYGGVGRPAQWSVPEGSMYYDDRLRTAFVRHDPGQANRLLDAMGLNKRNADGMRLLWSGRPLIMDVNATAERPSEAVPLLCDHWRRIGVDARLRLRSGPDMRTLCELGVMDIGIYKEGGSYFGPLLAGGLAPRHPAESTHWYRWAQYLYSHGQSGQVPPQRILELKAMWEDVVTAPNSMEKLAAWHALCTRTARELPLIAIMTSPGKPVLVRNNVRNVPRMAMAGWMAHEPGNCCPECFFFVPEE